MVKGEGMQALSMREHAKEPINSPGDRKVEKDELEDCQRAERTI